MKHRSSFILCLLASLSVQGYGQESGNADGSDVSEAESRFLFINLLEFLGEFETEDGEWISPDTLEDDVFTALDSQNNGNNTVDGRTGGSSGNAGDGGRN